MISKDEIYNKSPMLIQEIAVNAFALNRKLKREGKEFNKNLSFLMESYFWSKAEIEEFQLTQMNKLIKNCRENSKYYNEKLKDSPKHLKNLIEINNLPITSKKNLKDHFNDIITTNKNVHYFSTSGTSGNPLKIALTSKEWSLENAVIWRQKILAGIKRGDKYVSFGARNVVSQDEKKRFWQHNYIDKQLIFSAFHMNVTNFSNYVEKFNSWKPEYIQGHPSSIYLFANFILSTDANIRYPKAIFTSSETLLSYQRETIEKAFNCKIYDFYGSTERAGIITQCNSGNYHVNIETGYLEIIDEIFYWTSFLNHTTPMIRYRVGDTGKYKLTSNKCECGSFFPMIEDIYGRDDDYIITKDNRKIRRISSIFSKDLNIKEAQIIQNSIGRINVLLVPDLNFRYEIESKNIIKSFQQRVGNMLDIDFEIVKSLNKTERNKFKFIINNIDKDGKIDD